MHRRRIGLQVPPCSLQCVEQFIKTNYPPSVCSDSQDVDCLCTQRSASNLTLGEAALRCVFSSCPSPGNLELQVYGICLGVVNYLPNTHSQLTATAMATSVPTSNSNSTSASTSTPVTTTSRVTLPVSTTTSAIVTPTSTSSTTSSSSRPTISSPPPTSIFTSITSTAPGFTSTTSIASISTSTTLTEALSSQTSVTHENNISPTWTTTSTSTTVSSSSSTSTASASAAASSGALSKGQLVGIYVGAGAAFVSVVAIFLFCFLRKRRRDKFQKLKDPDFEIGGSMREPTPTGSISDRPPNPIPHTPIGAYNTLSMGSVVPKPSIMQHQYERSSSNSSRDTRDNLSAASRAESELLPDNPNNYRGVDATRPNIMRTRPDNSASLIADYPENRPTVKDVSNRQRIHITRQNHMNEVDTGRKSLSPQMYGLPAHPKISWSPKSHPQRYPEYEQPYIPTTPTYENPYWTTFDGTSLRPAKSLRVGPEAMAPPPLRPLSKNNGNGHSAATQGYGSNHGSRDFTNRRQSRGAARYSGASSTTSFESSVSKEAELAVALQAHTPARLSPVREVNSRGTSRSPVRNTPQSVPAVPRRNSRRSRIDAHARDSISPLYSPALSTPQHNSLLAKRRGPTVANRMEDQFTVHPGPGGPPRRSIRRVSSFATPSSTTNNYNNNNTDINTNNNNQEGAGSRPSYHQLPYPNFSPFQTQSPFKYDYDFDYENGYEHAGGNNDRFPPKGRRVTPTKRESGMYLRFD